MTITITAAEARELLTRAVEEKGADYVYPRSQSTDDGDEQPACLYFESDGTPSCIVGHILAYKGMPPFEDEETNTTSVFGLVDSGIVAADDDVASALRIAQRKQDGGLTWGDALAWALADLGEDDE